MFGLNIDPRNTKGNPDPSELKALGVETVRYTYYDLSKGNQLDPDMTGFYQEKIKSYAAAGIKSLIILTYDTYPDPPAPEADDKEWAAYIARFTRRTGQIARLLAPWRPDFQVWNEPDYNLDTPGYVPNLRKSVYAQMLQQTYETLKKIIPNSWVVTAGLASGNPGWLRDVISLVDGSLPADAVAFHPYGQRPDPDWPHPNWFFGYVGDLVKGYFRAGQSKPIWITEMGIKKEDVGNDAEQTAEFLRRYYQTMVTRYRDKVKNMFWFCYSDGMVSPFGLLDQNSQRKPLYFAYQQAVQWGQDRLLPPEATDEAAETPFVSPPPAPPLVQPSSEPPTLPPLPPEQTIRGQLEILRQHMAELRSRMTNLDGRSWTVPVTPETIRSQISELIDQMEQLYERMVSFDRQSMSTMSPIFVTATTLRGQISELQGQMRQLQNHMERFDDQHPPVSTESSLVAETSPPVAPLPPEETIKGQIDALQGEMTRMKNQMGTFDDRVQQLLSQQDLLYDQMRQIQAQLAKDEPPTVPQPTAPPIENIANQLKKHPQKNFPSRSLNQIEQLIIHHTAINPQIGVERIAAYRVDKQDWPGIGYHYYITHKGVIQQTNDLTTISTHASQYDPVSIGICFAGNFNQVIPTDSQLTAGARLIAWLVQQFDLDIQDVYGYKELVNTQSPGLQWDNGLTWGQQLKSRVQSYL